MIQLAKLSGFSPIITTASLHNEELLKSLGATDVIDRKADVIKEVTKITNAPLDIVYDAVADESTQTAAWDIVAPGGTLILVSPAVVGKDKYKDKYIVEMIGNFHVVERELGKNLYSNLTQLLEDESIKVR